MYAYSDIYGPDSMGEDLKTLTAVDGENQSALAVEGSGGQIMSTDKTKTYNITMALIVMVALIILLQMTR